jgi:hypothetical protein
VSPFGGGGGEEGGKPKALAEEEKKKLAYLEDTVRTKLNFSLAKRQGILKSELLVRFGGHIFLNFSHDTQMNRIVFLWCI